MLSRFVFLTNLVGLYTTVWHRTIKIKHGIVLSHPWLCRHRSKKTDSKPKLKIKPYKPYVISKLLIDYKVTPPTNSRRLGLIPESPLPWDYGLIYFCSYVSMWLINTLTHAIISWCSNIGIISTSEFTKSYFLLDRSIDYKNYYLLSTQLVTEMACLQHSVYSMVPNHF